MRERNLTGSPGHRANPAQESAKDAATSVEQAVETIEDADVAVAEAATPLRNTPFVRLLGDASEIADQPPMIAICAATLASGLVLRNPRLARAGARMLASHALATGMKAVVKRSVDRTRPHVMDEEDRYERGAGRRNEGKFNSFPSGHTAGALAVANAFSREYPRYAVPARLAVAAIAAIQIPRCAHYPSDIAAGAAIGAGAETIVDRIVARVFRWLGRSR